MTIRNTHIKFFPPTTVANCKKIGGTLSGEQEEEEEAAAAAERILEAKTAIFSES